MGSLDRVERDVGSLRLPQWGRVVRVEGVVSWLVVDQAGVPVEPIRRFLADFAARNRPGSVRSYAYDLLRWWRWLRVVGVDWDKATSTEVRDLVLWLGQAAKLRRSPRTVSAATAGGVNPITRKRNLSDCYEPTTVRHSNAVVRSFCEYWIEADGRPLFNLRDRITEAGANGWLGEVQGLQISLDAARKKLAGLDRLERTNVSTGPVNIGMPIISR